MKLVKLYAPEWLPTRTTHSNNAFIIPTVLLVLFHNNNKCVLNCQIVIMVLNTNQKHGQKLRVHQMTERTN